jgi:hypothetical protein
MKVRVVSSCVMVARFVRVSCSLGLRLEIGDNGSWPLSLDARYVLRFLTFEIRRALLTGLGPGVECTKERLRLSSARRIET